jgi:hypothetical protein
VYHAAYKYNDEIIFYFDPAGNKYVASGGSLAWRINNPGLVRSHGHFSRSNGSIGSCGRYAIFSSPQDGRKALSTWLHSKKYYDSTLKTIAEHYQPNASKKFINELSSLAKISPATKIKSLNEKEFNQLIISIEKLCGYASKGNETFSLLPKIIAKIENSTGQEDTYLIGDNNVLSKKEAIEWVLSHRLDGVVVRERNGSVYLRSRPNHCIWNLKLQDILLPSLEGQIETLVRTVGESRPDQCVWAFINGVKNTKEEALESANQISTAAGGERVFSMPNDTVLRGLKDFLVCIALKTIIDTPIVTWAVKFLRYLLAVSKQESKTSPVILFVHSQGAIITEHALEQLNQNERGRLRIFTFGGGSFLLPGKSHEDSHNYASAADYVCRIGSLNDQYLALERYYGYKEGLSDQQIIDQLAMQDAMLHLDSINPKAVEAYVKGRNNHYQCEFDKIKNVTVLDPDPDCKWKHQFDSDCYQTMVKKIVKRYQKN